MRNDGENFSDAILPMYVPSGNEGVLIDEMQIDHFYSDKYPAKHWLNRTEESFFTDFAMVGIIILMNYLR